MTYFLTVPPAAEPVTLAEAKLAARLDGDAFDSLIPSLIKTAREMAEQTTGRRLVTQTWQLRLDEWPCDLTLERTPVKTVETVQYWNGVDWSTVSSSQYVLVPGPIFTTIKPALGVTWPTPAAAVGPRVRITFTAGYGDAAAVPESIKTWIKSHVAFWVRNPEAANERAMIESPFLGRLLDGHLTCA
jgi:uncharacterized phiE125 gp8 family phage protein